MESRDWRPPEDTEASHHSTWSAQIERTALPPQFIKLNLIRSGDLQTISTDGEFYPLKVLPDLSVASVDGTALIAKPRIGQDAGILPDFLLFMGRSRSWMKTRSASTVGFGAPEGASSSDKEDTSCQAANAERLPVPRQLRNRRLWGASGR